MPLRQRNGEPVSRHGRSRPQSVADQRRWHQRAPPLFKTPLPTASPQHCCAAVACLPAWTDAPVCADATSRRARATAARGRRDSSRERATPRGAPPCTCRLSRRGPGQADDSNGKANSSPSCAATSRPQTGGSGSGGGTIQTWIESDTWAASSASPE